ncbi:hypothetical protein D3C75_1040000 [compost metagenome]
MSLAVLLDPVGQVAQTPVLDLGDGTAAFFDQSLDGVVQRFGLLRRDILARHDRVLVKSHAVVSLVGIGVKRTG